MSCPFTVRTEHNTRVFMEIRNDTLYFPIFLLIGVDRSYFLFNQCLSAHTFVSSNPAHGAVYSIQHNVIKFVCDLRQVGGFSTNKTDNITDILFKNPTPRVGLVQSGPHHHLIEN
jgi:hypothetical protein